MSMAAEFPRCTPRSVGLLVFAGPAALQGSTRADSPLRFLPSAVPSCRERT